ncbi:MAG: hypothetical protein AABX96_00770 [Nanoarchaeota archaeon]
MVTTIQVNERTLLLLKKLKEELQAKSYEDAITKIANQRMKVKESMAGSLRKYLKNSQEAKKIIKEVQNDRRKEDNY